jgi:hypothetical protein
VEGSERECAGHFGTTGGCGALRVARRRARRAAAARRDVARHPQKVSLKEAGQTGNSGVEAAGEWRGARIVFVS